jgi:hypothetical protein
MGFIFLAHIISFHIAGAGTEVAGVEDYVVAFAVAEGAGDAEAEVGGFEGEGEFGEFSATLGGEFVLTRGLSGPLLLDRILLNGLRARR